MLSLLSDLTPPVLLRPAVSTDALRLAQLWRQAWSSANPTALRVEPLPHWQERVRAEFGPPCTVLLAERGDEALLPERSNEALLAEHDNEALLAFVVLDLAQCHVHQLFVAPTAQSRGVGGALLRQICERLCPTGWTLHVATANHRARQFYARCGLVEEAVSLHPLSGRERVLCRWTPPAR